MKASETTRHESEQREEATHPSESNVLTLEEFTKLLKEAMDAAERKAECRHLNCFICHVAYQDARDGVLAAYSRALGLIEVQTKVKEMGNVLINAMADRLEKLEP